MANRTMQAKTMKMKRMRRAWAKPYNIPSDIRPNIEVLSDYQMRAKGLAFSDAEQEELYRMYFKRASFKGVSPPRKEVLDTLIKVREVSPAMLFFNVIDNCYQRARMYFNSQKSQWILVHEDYIRCNLRRSTIYRTKETLEIAWNTNRVIWVERSKLPYESAG